MSNLASPSSPKPARKEVSPPVAIGIVIVVLLVCGYVGYRWMNQPRIPTSVYVKAARYWIEKPERDKLEAQHLSKAQIDSKIQEMWDKGTLKLPPGEPGVDWAGTPTGIVYLPKSAADVAGMRAGGGTAPSPPAHAGSSGR